MKGKVAIVTGGSSGIGRAAAVALAKEGAKVVVAARRQKEGEETVKMMKDAGGDGIFVRTDVTKEDDVKSLVEKTIKEYGRLDYAFNNAGVIEDSKLLADQTLETFHGTISVNLRGVFFSMKYEIPQMLKSGGGAIVNMSSIAGLVGIPELSIYVASKHAVAGLTKAAAQEYAKSGIRINAVAPGAIETDMLRKVRGENPELQESINAQHPIGRIGNPDEVAEAVVWLLSDKSSFVVGHILSVDGGWASL